MIALYHQFKTSINFLYRRNLTLFSYSTRLFYFLFLLVNIFFLNVVNIYPKINLKMQLIFLNIKFVGGTNLSLIRYCLLWEWDKGRCHPHGFVQSHIRESRIPSLPYKHSVQGKVYQSCVVPSTKYFFFFFGWEFTFFFIGNYRIFLAFEKCIFIPLT